MPFLLQTPQLDSSDLMLPDSVQKAQMAEVYNRIVSADYNEVLNALVRDCVWIVIKIVLAMFIYIVGRQIIRWIVRILDRAFVHHEVELSLRTFLRSAVKAVMMIVLLMLGNVIFRCYDFLIPRSQMLFQRYASALKKR